MKHTFRIAVWVGAAALVAGQVSVALAATNVAPTPVVIQAVQRPGTTYMDIDYQVDDPDDATVETAALGFVNGGTSFSDIVKISTLVEGTAANIGSNTPANTQLRLTWNVAADWNTNFGNVQVEILAKDGRGLLPFHWITLPSNGPNPEVTINNRPIYDEDLLPLWYWLIATGDPGVQLVNGQILGVGSDYRSNVLAQDAHTTSLGRRFLWERFKVHSISTSEITRANAGRYGFASVDEASVCKGFVALDGVYARGNNDAGQLNPMPVNITNISAVALGERYTLVLAGGGVTGWGDNAFGQISIPASATNVVAIAAGSFHSLALKADGTVVAWGAGATITNSNPHFGQAMVPASATNVVAIAAGWVHSLALKADGMVVGWGYSGNGRTDTPASATNVVAIGAGIYHSLALRADGTVVGWGYNDHGETDAPSSATNVTGIAVGLHHNLALRTDGTVVGWGYNGYGQTTIPASATNVVAIAAGMYHSLALKADGTVVVWGYNGYGQLDLPAGLSGIDLLGVGSIANHIVVVDKRTP